MTRHSELRPQGEGKQGLVGTGTSSCGGRTGGARHRKHNFVGVQNKTLTKVSLIIRVRHHYFLRLWNRITTKRFTANNSF